MAVGRIVVQIRNDYPNYSTTTERGYRRRTIATTTDLASKQMPLGKYAMASPMVQPIPNARFPQERHFLSNRQPCKLVKWLPHHHLLLLRSMLWVEGVAENGVFFAHVFHRLLRQFLGICTPRRQLIQSWCFSTTSNRPFGLSFRNRSHCGSECACLQFGHFVTLSEATWVDDRSL